MPTPVELLDQALAKLRSANRIDGNRNSYRKDSPNEYAAVMSYLSGGTRPPAVVSDMGVGLMLAEDARRGLVVVEPEPEPEPEEGFLYDRFTDFWNRAWGYNEHPNGDIFVNRWRTPEGYQGLADPASNWPSTGGAAITEVSTSKGPGFRFVCNAEMNNGSGVKRVELCDINAGGSPHAPAQKFVRGNGFTDEIRFWVRYPSSGNPNGIPGNTNRWNLCFQIFDNSANSINLSMGLNMEGGARKFFFDTMKPQGQPAAATVDALQMQFDVDYRVRIQVKWATSGGYMKTWIDDVPYLNYSGANLFGSSHSLLACPTYYGPSSLNNEVIFSDVRTIQVQMAISANHLTEGGSDVDANSFTTASISPTANALVLAAVAAGQTGAPTQPTLTGNGLTWELEDSALYDITGTYGTLWLFRALGASPTSGTLAIAFGGVTHLACVWGIDEFTGVDASGSNGAGAIVQSVSEVETDLGTTASVTLSAFSSVDNATYGAVAKQTAEDFTQGSGFTILSDFNVATPVVSVMAEWKTANDTVVDCSWATTGQKSGIIGVEIKAEAAAGETQSYYATRAAHGW